MRDVEVGVFNKSPTELTHLLADYPKQYRTTRWFTPARGPDAERRSLFYQHADVVFRDVPPGFDEVLAQVADMYPSTQTGWAGGLRELLNSPVVERIIDSIKPESSPGYPWMQLGKSNADLIKESPYTENVMQEVGDRLKLLASCDFNLRSRLSCDPLAAVRMGLCDPVRVFIKNEPHKEKKATVGRWRIICSVSLVDQIVEKLIYWGQDDFEKNHWKLVPSKPGMGLDSDTDLDALRQYSDVNQLSVGSDASGFDITQPAFLVRGDQKVRELLATDATPEWLNAGRNYTECMIHKVLITSDGKSYVRQIPGGMASGRFVTASSNSRSRGIIHAWCAKLTSRVPRFMTMGDDCVERRTLPADVLARVVYEVFGVKLTDIEDDCSSFSFCSHRFSKSSVVPENVEKLLIKYLASQSKDYPCLERNLRAHPDAENLLKLARKALGE